MTVVPGRATRRAWVIECAAALEALRGKPAIYHCISRVVDRRFVFGTPEKEKFVGLMRAYEQFCQVRVLAFCVMSNHFHLAVEVPPRPAEGLTPEELVERAHALGYRALSITDECSVSGVVRAHRTSNAQL